MRSDKKLGMKLIRFLQTHNANNVAIKWLIMKRLLFGWVGGQNGTLFNLNRKKFWSQFIFS